MKPTHLCWRVLAHSIILLLMVSLFTEGAQAAAKLQFVYIGTYTDGKSKGIYVSRFNDADGSLSAPELAAETKNPSFLAIHPNHHFLYAVGEIDSFQGKRAGAVSAFTIDPKTGKLILLNQQPSGGSGPCHVEVERKGRSVLVANYGSGSIASLPLEADGQLKAPNAVQHFGSSVNKERQSGPHAHFITTDPQNRIVLACDLGLDKVLLYDADAFKGALRPHDPSFGSVPAGAGPRHLVFHPGGKWVYVINEMGSSITMFDYNSKRGALAERQTISTLPENFSGANSAAEIQIHASGKFVYGSNRGHNSIAIFRVDEKTGALTSAGHQSTGGKTPRHFSIAPSGRWLLAENQDSHNIITFALDEQSGGLTPTGHSVEVGSPVCLAFLTQ